MLRDRPGFASLTEVDGAVPFPVATREPVTSTFVQREFLMLIHSFDYPRFACHTEQSSDTLWQFEVFACPVSELVGLLVRSFVRSSLYSIHANTLTCTCAYPQTIVLSLSFSLFPTHSFHMQSWRREALYICRMHQISGWWFQLVHQSWWREALCCRGVQQVGPVLYEVLCQTRWRQEMCPSEL